MSKRLTFKGSKVKFPQQCLICGQPAGKDYSVSRTLSYGRNTVTLTIPIPLCLQHFEIASKKNQAEKLTGWIGLILGAIAGIAVTVGLLSYWAATQQGNLVTNLFLAAFVGLGIFLSIWLLFAYFVAPLFGSPDSKAVRNAMKIRHYWPGSGDIQLEFADEAVAEKISSINADRLLQKE